MTMRAVTAGDSAGAAATRSPEHERLDLPVGPRECSTVGHTAPRAPEPLHDALAPPRRPALPRRVHHRVFECHSDDDGLTWTPPREITRDVKRPAWGWYATGPGAAIQLARGPHAGRIVVACNHRETGVDRSHVITSDDDGGSWRIGGITAEGTNEARTIELAGGSVMLNSRNHGVPDRNRASLRHTTRAVPRLAHGHWPSDRDGVGTSFIGPMPCT